MKKSTIALFAAAAVCLGLSVFSVEGYSFDDVKKYVTEAREIVDSYLTAEQYSLVENYADLTALESEYTSSGSTGGATEEVSIPMC